MAERMAGIALGHVTREYPHKLDHVIGGPEDLLSPQALHPIFYGSFDWHSCVHGWWTLLTLRRMFPEMAEAAVIDALAASSFTAEKVAAELAYLNRPSSAGFERPYGWGWLLALHLEATRHEGIGDTLDPLAKGFASRLAPYLAKLTYPIRTGTHANTSFALILALEWAEAFDAPLAATIRAWASEKFAGDHDCQAWEPGGDEFLSSALTETLLMRRCLGDAAFADWFAAFLPRIAVRDPATLFTPATVSDRSDGKIAHLDGLNLSRAWCWRGIAPALPPAERAVALDTADDHLATALPHIAGDYMGEHWLASFALLALTA
mgnify:CR=1 FL=1